MNKPIRTKTPAGDDIVILPAADYDSLIELAEDAVDIHIAEQRLSELRSGKSETVTHQEMLELLDAPSPIGFWRKRRGLTQAALAGEIGVSQGYLAQLESAKRSGDVGIYRRLSSTLKVDIEELLPPEGQSPKRRPAATTKPRRRK
ncbi:MAG: helix-turn-helix transcriptional regulator [Bauldia sp.]